MLSSVCMFRRLDEETNFSPYVDDANNETADENTIETDCYVQNVCDSPVRRNLLCKYYFIFFAKILNSFKKPAKKERALGARRRLKCW